MPNILSDILFPAAKPLKNAAQGNPPAPPTPVPPGQAGIDVAAEAQKAAARAKAAAPPKAVPAAPNPANSKDHYAPRGQ
jgi:hypothetical protein